MLFALKIEGDVLSLRISDVDDTPNMRGRVCNMELALLTFWGFHKSAPVIKEGGKLTFGFIRGDSNHDIYTGARKVLEGFAVKWLDGVNGIQE